MIPEIVQFALILALLLALTQATLPLIGAARGNRALIAVAAPAGQAIDAAKHEKEAAKTVVGP